MSGRFRADPVDARIAIEMDGMVVLFHRPSGMTHLLISPAPEILDVIADVPGDCADILARLRARFDVDVEGDMMAVVRDRLIELEAAGLVARL